MKRLNPSLIPKFINQLEKLPVFEPSFYKRESKVNYNYSVDACEFYQQILPPGYEKTKVWGFAGLCKDNKNKGVKYIKYSPGPTFEVKRDTNVNIQWNNKIMSEYMFRIDTTIPWANPNNINSIKEEKNNNMKEGQWPPTLAMHLNGMISSPVNDGNPRTWYTATGIKGPLYTNNYYKFTNEQPSCTLWYYDQSPGVSRISVYSGLCGLYLIKDEDYDFPKGDYHIPLIIQDKSFYEDGSLYYNDKSNLSEHPHWNDKFFGDVIVVNGKAWPSLKVENQLYKFDILNGSNCRPYKIALSDNSKMIQIGTDSGYIHKPQELTYFVLYPGERIQILIEFSKYKTNDKIIMKNLFVTDECEDIMEFVVSNATNKIEYCIPEILKIYPKIKINREKLRTFIVKTKDNKYLFDGKDYFEPPNFIKVGSCFIWEFINISEEDTCIHLHLVHFQIIERQKINKKIYQKNYDINDGIYEEIYLPEKYEEGFKDTLYCPAFCTTRIIVRYAPYYIMEDINMGENFYSFNPSEGPEYIINSQILEQKDNYMIRPQVIIYEE